LELDIRFQTLVAKSQAEGGATGGLIFGFLMFSFLVGLMGLHYSNSRWKGNSLCKKFPDGLFSAGVW
jgi:hypothetical protein